jgi:hypothetical protein
MRYRDYDGGYPPLPSDVMTDVTSEDDPAYADQGFDRAEHVKRLKTARLHAKACARCLRRALDTLDDEPLGPEDADIEPTDFGDDTDNQQTERARRAALATLRNLAR